MSLSVSQKARLGAFIIGAAILMGLFFAVPLGLRVTNKFNTYIAYFEGESLSGLEVGAVVKFNGVPVGSVINISYQPDNLSRVKVVIEIQNGFPMKVDMFATTSGMGITGLKYLEISGGTNEAELLKSGAEIPTRMSMMASITGKAETITEKIDLLLNHLTLLTDPDSLGGIKNIVDNVAAISNDAKLFFNDALPAINRMTSSSEVVINKVNNIADDVKNFTDAFNSELSGENVASVLGKFDSTVVSMKNLTDQLSLLVLQSREDFSISMENIREATDNANQLTRLLSENPSLLLRGEGREREIR